MSESIAPKRTRVNASGRTEPLFIRVRPELKEYVVERVLLLGGNNSEYVENLIEQDMKRHTESASL